MDKQQIFELIDNLIDSHETLGGLCNACNEYYHNGAVDALIELKEEINNKFNESK